jgi:hypothetical protein
MIDGFAQGLREGCRYDAKSVVGALPNSLNDLNDLIIFALVIPECHLQSKLLLCRGC